MRSIFYHGRQLCRLWMDVSLRTENTNDILLFLDCGWMSQLEQKNTRDILLFLSSTFVKYIQK